MSTDQTADLPIQIGIPPLVYRALLMVPTSSNGWQLNDLKRIVVEGRRYWALTLRRRDLARLEQWIIVCHSWVGYDRRAKLATEPDRRVTIHTSSGGDPDPLSPPYDEFALVPEHALLESWLLAVSPLVRRIRQTNDLVTLIGLCAKVIVAPEPEGCIWRERRSK